MTTGVVASAWWSCTELSKRSVCVYYSRSIGLELKVLQKRLSCCSIQPNLIAVMFGYE